MLSAKNPDIPEGPNSELPYKNVEYYFTSIVFLVENQLFKVPRRNFETESEIFSDMFQLPAPVDSSVDGSSDDQPLRLDGVKKSDFVQLLRVMFPIDSQPRDVLTVDEWTSVLKLSSMWQFRTIRTTAIKTLGNLSMDLIDKIVIARKFDISCWLVPTLNALIQREKPLDFLEGNRLGMEWVLKVAEVRELDANATPKAPTCSHCNHTGPARCNSCSSTTFNRCGSCSNYLPATPTAGSKVDRTNVDYSERIREVFELA